MTKTLFICDVCGKEISLDEIGNFKRYGHTRRTGELKNYAVEVSLIGPEYSQDFHACRVCVLKLLNSPEVEAMPDRRQ